jgi:hypothetical protein
MAFKSVRARTASRLPIALAALAAVQVFTAAAAPPAATLPRPSAETAAKVGAILRRGRLLFDLDRAAWVATDDFLKKVRDPATVGFKGYVVDREGEGFAVTFYSGEGDLLTARYIAHVGGGRVTSSRLLAAAEQVPLNPLQLRMAKARSVVPSAEIRPCTNARFNASIIPPTSLDEPLEMYLTSAQTSSDVFPFGGHYLLGIAPDGRLLSVRKFTNACLNMERPRGGRRGQPVAIVVAHLLDPLPTEIHVFMSLSTRQPVFVAIGNPPHLWLVTGDGIGEVPMPGQPARQRRD